MKDRSRESLYLHIYGRKRRQPFLGTLELTYRCNLNCIYCNCNGLGDEQKELKAKEWKRIIDEIREEGCLGLTFTGGEPLIRKDFLELYSYAKSKGFLVHIFSNGQLFTEEIINYLSKSPPCSIEITLNGITQNTYETITQVKGSFYRVMNVIRKLAKTDLFVRIKTNCLKQNKHEIGRIKAFTEELFGKPAKNKYRFRCGEIITPRLNGDTTPCNYRLSWSELLEIKRQDKDLWKEYQERLCHSLPDLKRDNSFLYRCGRRHYFLINPYGRLKICTYTDKFSVDLRNVSFRYGFYKVFPRILSQRFKTNSKCKACRLRPICHYCPAMAYLETGDEEFPVTYFCEIARAYAAQIKSQSRTRPGSDISDEKRYHRRLFKV